MPYLPLLLLLLLCTCGRAQLGAQPRTDPIRTMENISPITNAYGKKWNKLMENGNGWAAAELRDSMGLAIIDQYATPSYLVDRNGTVWNLGVVEMPFVIHTFYLECRGCKKYVTAINTVATEYADEVITFVLLPAPEEPYTNAVLDLFNENVIVLFDDYFRDPNHFPDDSRLLGLIGYPTSYYLTSKRQIIGVASAYTSMAYLNKKGEKAVERKLPKNLKKTLRKWMKLLLQFKQSGSVPDSN